MLSGFESGLDFLFGFDFLLDFDLGSFFKILSMKPGLKSDSVDDEDDYEEVDEGDDKSTVSFDSFGKIMEIGLVMSSLELVGG
jgi:hypothetical protein